MYMYIFLVLLVVHICLSVFVQPGKGGRDGDRSLSTGLVTVIIAYIFVSSIV